MRLTYNLLGLFWSDSRGNEVSRDHSQKQRLLATVIARQFELELKRIHVGKTVRYCGNFFDGS